MRPHSIERVVSVLRSVYILIILAGIASSQTKPAEEAIKVDTLLLNVPIVVSHKDGRNLTDITKKDLSVFQGDEERSIEFFAGLDTDLTIAIVIDGSGSTSSLIKEIKKSAISFVGTLGPLDRCMVVKFGSKAKVLVDLTQDKQKITKAISGFDTPAGDSNMNEALFEVLKNRFSTIKGRKAVIVLTDGFVDSQISNDVIRDLVINSDTLVYPILFRMNTNRRTPKYAGIPLYDDENRLKTISNSTHYYGFLNKLAGLSGGRLLAAWLGSFDESFRNIAAELKRHYVIGFHPVVVAEDGSIGDIKIKVKREGTSIRTKSTIRLPKPDSNK